MMSMPPYVSLRGIFLLLMVCTIAACNTTQQRKTEPPKPRPVYEPQEQSQQQSQQQQAQQQQAQHQQSQQRRSQQQSQAAQQQTYMSPSEDAAEVEVEEIRTDGQADEPRQPQQSQQARAPGTRSSDKRRQGNDAGGAAAPRYAESNSGQRDPAQSGGMVMLPPGTNSSADEDMIGPQINIGARTEAEQIAALDGELSSQMASFDERMRRARAAAEAQKMQQIGGGGRTGMQGGRGQRYEIDSQQRGGGGAAATSTGLGNTPDLTGETSGAHQPVVIAARPANIPDGRDDDIVARQLREAATKESDPVLREKLWEEYRKYKAGL